MPSRLLALALSLMVLVTTGSTLGALLLARSFTSNALAEEGATCRMMAVGDIMTSRMVMRRLWRPPTENYPFTYVRDTLLSADVVFGNLETPVTEGEEVSPTTMQFRSDPSAVNILQAHNIRLISLANNHMFDMKRSGMLRTIELLNNANIAHAGAGMNEAEAHAPATIDCNGLTLALLAYIDPMLAPAYVRATDTEPGMAVMDPERVKHDIAAAKEQADIVIVSMHAGHEYTLETTDTQREFAHAAIDAGAATVLGHHPHWVQEMEMYQGKPIFYSLGNFVFDQLWSRETREGVMVGLTLSNNGVDLIQPYAVYMDSNYQPTMGDAQTADRVMSKLYPQVLAEAIPVAE